MFVISVILSHSFLRLLLYEVLTAKSVYFIQLFIFWYKRYYGDIFIDKETIENVDKYYEILFKRARISRS